MPTYLDPLKFQGDMNYHDTIHKFWRDVIRVKNPLDKDFRFKYDSVFWTIKANATQDWERYLAYHYAVKVSEHIIGQMISEMGNKALEERVKQQRGILLIDKYMENREIWDKLPRLDDPALRKKIAEEVIVGLISRYGEDTYEETNPNKGKVSPNTMLYQDLMDEAAKRVPVEEKIEEEVKKEVAHEPKVS